MELFEYSQLVKLELLSNAATIDSALDFIEIKKQGSRKGQTQIQRAL
jgi:hypothetical protein